MLEAAASSRRGLLPSQDLDRTLSRILFRRLSIHTDAAKLADRWPVVTMSISSHAVDHDRRIAHNSLSGSCERYASKRDSASHNTAVVACCSRAIPVPCADAGSLHLRQCAAAMALPIGCKVARVFGYACAAAQTAWRGPPCVFSADPLSLGPAPRFPGETACDCPAISCRSCARPRARRRSSRTG